MLNWITYKKDSTYTTMSKKKEIKGQRKQRVKARAEAIEREQKAIARQEKADKRRRREKEEEDSWQAGRDRNINQEPTKEPTKSKKKKLRLY